MPHTQPVTRAPADQLLLDLAERWLWQHDATAALVRADAELSVVRPQQAITSAALSLIYVLALLREHAPEVADRAVDFVRQDDDDAWPEAWIQSPRARVVDLIDALLEGRTPAVPLAPVPSQA